MGMFSVMCAGGCGHPLLCGDAAGEVNAWMTDGVAITPQGSLVTGMYDGYGRLSGTDIAGETDATAWHRACWETAGQPAGYLGPSDPAADQGWFFDDGDHDMPDPRGQQPAAGQAAGERAEHGREGGRQHALHRLSCTPQALRAAAGKPEEQHAAPDGPGDEPEP